MSDSFFVYLLLNRDFYRDIPLAFHHRLAGEAIGLVRHAHVFFAIVTGIQLVSARTDITHARGAKSVASAGVLNRYPRIERDMQKRFPFFGVFHSGDLIAVTEGDGAHGRMKN